MFELSKLNQNPHAHLEGHRKVAFDIFIAALFALVAAVLIDLWWHPPRIDAKPWIACGSPISLANIREAVQPGDASLGLVAHAVLSCIESPKKKADVPV